MYCCICLLHQTSQSQGLRTSHSSLYPQCMPWAGSQKILSYSWWQHLALVTTSCFFSCIAVFSTFLTFHLFCLPLNVMFYSWSSFFPDQIGQFICITLRFLLFFVCDLSPTVPYVTSPVLRVVTLRSRGAIKRWEFTRSWWGLLKSLTQACGIPAVIGFLLVTDLSLSHGLPPLWCYLP